MKLFKLGLVSDPSFNTVINLSNIVFDPDNVRSGHMATEDQMKQLYNRIFDLEARREECCAPMGFWEAHVQVVQMNTLSLTSYDNLRGGGQVISSFDENVQVGTMKKGFPYTVTFPLKWNDSTYVPRDVSAASINDCTNAPSASTSSSRLYTNYRIIEDNSITVSSCNASTTTIKGFWFGGQPLTSPNNNRSGHFINPQNVWDNFVHQIANDGTVTIKDLRKNTNFSVIRYYTQWILRQTADGQTIPDPTPVSP